MLRRKRPVSILFVAALLVLPAWAMAAPSAPSGAYAPHDAIHIRGDADFTWANGVRGGSGTPADPYVIRGWHVVDDSSGTAIRIEDVTRSFVVRGNLLECRSAGSVCVRIQNATGNAWVGNNHVVNSGTGMRVLNADPVIEDNTFTDANRVSNVAVHLTDSNAVVRGNHVEDHKTGVEAQRGAPRVTFNAFTGVATGIRLAYTGAGALVAENGFTDVTWTGVEARDVSRLTVRDNTLDAVRTGIDVADAVDLTLRGNRITNADQTALHLVSVDAFLRDNRVTGVAGDGLVAERARVDLARDAYVANEGIGIRLVDATGTVADVTLRKNGGGIALEQGSVVTLRDNVLTDNAFGLSIPYESRASIPLLTGNVVNGWPVDAPGYEVFHYRTANVQVTDQVRDSGFQAGHYGALSLQGQLVLYDVDTARVDGSVLSHGVAGVHAVNAFDVQVDDSELLANRIGVHLDTARTGDPLAPPCVGSVKNTTIDIPVDPPATYGVKAGAHCLALVSNTTIARVDVGIHLDARASAHVANNTIFETREGVHVAGQVKSGRNVFTFENNVVTRNRVGFHLRATGATLVENDVTFHSDAGVRLDVAANPRLIRNNVSFNVHGVIDARACTGPHTCSSLHTQANEFVENEVVAVRVNGSADLKGDVILGSGDTGLMVNGEARVDGVTSIGNGRDGAYLNGVFDVEGSVFSHNERHGLTIVGSGRLDASAFLHNDEAGLRVRAILVVAERLDVGYNRDGIRLDEEPPEVTVNPPTVDPPAPGELLPDLPLQREQDDPLFIHMSDIHNNFRNALRAPVGVVNATQNWWGSEDGPVYAVPGLLEYGNTVNAGAAIVTPYWKDQEKTRVGVVFMV